MLVGFAPSIPITGAATVPIRFGLDLGTVDAQVAAGAWPDFGMFWVGPWTLKSGWGGPDALLDKARTKGVTPVIQFYYWGNDISVSCLENGCWSSIHNAYKSKAGWAQLATQLGSHLSSRLGGREAIVILETEFNKGGVEGYEPLDGYLAEKARAIKASYPAARVAVGFGNWNPTKWGTFDRAVAASDYAGLQGLRASTRNAYADYVGLVDATLRGAQELQRRFGKPIFLHDVGLSSYPEPAYSANQAVALGRFFERLSDLRAAGVQGLVYRAFRDAPTATTAEYFGEAERHWGLASSTGVPKAAWAKWKDGLAAARGTSGAPMAPTVAGAVLRVEAESFATKPVGGWQWDSSASGSRCWNLWANGKISQPVRLASPGLYEVRVRAEGRVLANVAPHLNVYVDATHVASADPWAGAWSDTVGRLRVDSAGTRTIHLQFTNDALSSAGDRNLLLDRVEVRWLST